MDKFRSQMAMLADGSLWKKVRKFVPRSGLLCNAVDELQAVNFKATIGILDAMTAAERAESDLLDNSRRERIAAGSGCTLQEVVDLVRWYQAMAKVAGESADQQFVAPKERRERRESYDWRRPPFPPDDEGDDPPPDNPWSPMPA
nr:hypothetical protein [Aeoliella straminimaris]